MQCKIRNTEAAGSSSVEHKALRAWKHDVRREPYPAVVDGHSTSRCQRRLRPHLAIRAEAAVHLEPRTVLLLAALHAGAGALAVDCGGRALVAAAAQPRRAPLEAEARVEAAARVLLQVVTHVVSGVVTAGERIGRQKRGGESKALLRDRVRK